MAAAVTVVSEMASVKLPEIDADDGCGTQLRYLLHRHGLCGEFRATASDPLPANLLSALRLHAMTPAELYLRDAPPEHANPPPAVEFVGAQNERYALLSARRLLRDHKPSAHAVAVLLERLCCVAPEAPLRRHARDGAMQAALGALGGRGAVALADCAAGGRGLVSGAPLRRGAVVLALPAGALLSAAAARAALGADVAAAVDEGAWTEHVLVMLLLLRERARGRASRWARWLRLLPAAFDNLASWSDAELRPLHGCDCYWQAVAAREEVAALHRSVAARVGAAAAGTLAEWRWAYGAVATRAIALPAALGELDAGALVIVPVLDMANHAAAAQLELTVDAASGELRATTLAAVGAGTQLFLSYGSLDAEALLLSYGVPPAAAAPLAPVTLALAPPPALESADDLLAAVLLLLQHMGLPLDGWAGGDGAPLPARLLGTARLLSLRSADELTALPIAAADARPLSDANERAAVALVAAAIEAALAALAEPPAGGGGGRRAAARLFCARRRAALEAALEAARARASGVGKKRGRE